MADNGILCFMITLRFWRILFGLLAVLFLLVVGPLLYLQWIVYAEMRNARLLADPARARHVMAQVTEQRNLYEGPDVRYRFQVPPDPAWYAHADFTGRKNLWVPIAPSAAEAIEANNNTIDVVYLPENPWANQPVQRTNDPVADSTVGLVATVVVCSIVELTLAIPLVALALVLWNLRRSKRRPSPGQAFLGSRR